MAIAFVRGGGAGSTAHNVASLTYSADATGGSILIVGVNMSLLVGGATITSVSYIKGGSTVNLTQTSSSPTDPNELAVGPVSLWYMDAPDTGSHNIVITPSSSTQQVILSAFVVLSGTLAGTPEGAGGTTPITASQTAYSTSITTVADNSFIVDIVADNNWGSSSSVSSLTMTAPGVQAAHFGEGTLVGDAVDMDYRPTTTAGAYTIAGTFSPGNRHTSIAMEVKAAVAAAAATYKPRLTLLGVS